MDGDIDDVGFVFAYRSLNDVVEVAPSLPPPSTLKMMMIVWEGLRAMLMALILPVCVF